MNERIKELALQCNEEVGDYQYGSIISFNIQKFAELIIDKCAEIAWRHTPDYEELEYSHLISNKIKEYFGVEE